jgi:hypothetical protein
MDVEAEDTMAAADAVDVGEDVAMVMVAAMERQTITTNPPLTLLVIILQWIGINYLLRNVIRFVKTMTRRVSKVAQSKA